MQRSRWIIAALAVVAGACSDAPLQPGGAPLSAANAARVAAMGDVPAVHMDLPRTPRSWDTSDVALVAAIAREDGYATIALKETGSSRVLSNGGVRHAVTAASVRGGIALLRARGVEIVDVFDFIGAVRVKMAPDLAPALRAHPLVDYIEPRQWAETYTVATTPATFALRSAMATTSSPAQTTPWGVSLIGATAAWNYSRGIGARVEIVDTGHERGHEDLPLVPTTNCGGAYGGCDDSQPNPHGTHVTGILTARDNSIGVVGVAPEVRPDDLYFWGACDSYSSIGACDIGQIVAGIQDAALHARVLNMSFGGLDYDASEANAIAAAWAANVVLVAAAGNNQGNTIVYPAAFSNVVGVSGVNADKTFASSSPCPGASSNYGAHVDLAAPFWALSTVAGNSYEGTPKWCGTSMATPHVAGAAALLIAANPSWTNQQVVDRLIATAQDLGPAGRDDQYGYGLVDVAAALGATRLGVGMSGLGTIKRAGYYTYTASVTGGIGGYTYEWTRDDQPGVILSTTSSYTTYEDPAGGSYQFRLTLTVHSGYDSGSYTKPVSVINSTGI